MSLRRLVVFVRTEDGKPDRPFAVCVSCGYSWQPRRGVATVATCPRCHRTWWEPAVDRYVARCMCGHLKPNHKEGCQVPACDCVIWRPRQAIERRRRLPMW